MCSFCENNATLNVTKGARQKNKYYDVAIQCHAGLVINVAKKEYLVNSKYCIKCGRKINTVRYMHNEVGHMKKCRFCEKEKLFFTGNGSNNKAEVFIHKECNNACLVLWGDDELEINIPIAHCPECGRALRHKY